MNTGMWHFLVSRCAVSMEILYCNALQLKLDVICSSSRLMVSRYWQNHIITLRARNLIWHVSAILWPVRVWRGVYIVCLIWKHSMMFEYATFDVQFLIWKKCDMVIRTSTWNSSNSIAVSNHLWKHHHRCVLARHPNHQHQCYLRITAWLDTYIDACLEWVLVLLTRKPSLCWSISGSGILSVCLLVSRLWVFCSSARAVVGWIKAFLRLFVFLQSFFTKHLYNKCAYRPWIILGFGL